MRTRMSPALASWVLVLAGSASLCGDDDSGDTTATGSQQGVSPSESVSVSDIIGGAAETPTPAPTADPQPQAGNAAYPLTDAEAISYVDAGVAVAGLLSDGSEVRIVKMTTTVYEEQQVLKEVCGYEYDSYTGEDEYECHDEYVTEKQPTQATVFQIGSSFTSLEKNSALAAVNTAVGFGVAGWRTD